MIASVGLAGLLMAACVGRPEAAQPIVLLDASGAANASEMLDSVHERGWDLHWSYDCSTTGGHGVFVVDVFDSDRTPDFTAPGVNEEGDRDSGVYHVAGSGRFYLEVTSTCRWTMKVLQVG